MVDCSVKQMLWSSDDGGRVGVPTLLIVVHSCAHNNHVPHTLCTHSVYTHNTHTTHTTHAHPPCTHLHTRTHARTHKNMLPVGKRCRLLLERQAQLQAEDVTLDPEVRGVS